MINLLTIQIMSNTNPSPSPAFFSSKHVSIITNAEMSFFPNLTSPFYNNPLKFFEKEKTKRYCHNFYLYCGVPRGGQ